MTTIIISTFSQEAASKTKGLFLKEMLSDSLRSGEEITVDFSGINRFASPFFNNSFASLATIYGFEAIEKIKLINITETGRHTYDTSLDNAKLLAEKPEFSDKFNTIFNNAPKKVD